MENLLNVGYFKLARNISKYSNHRVKVGAVIVKHKPISAASNKAKTHPRFANPYNSIRGSVHAEVRAILNSGPDDLSGASIYVYRECKDGSPAMARPCSSCITILKEYDIQTIYYTTSEYPYWKKERI